MRGPASFANVIPLPGTVTSDAVAPADAAEMTPDRRHRERETLAAGRPCAPVARRRGPFIEHAGIPGLAV